MLFPDQPEFTEGLCQVLTRAATDPDFRALCLEDPEQLLADEQQDEVACGCRDSIIILSRHFLERSARAC